MIPRGTRQRGGLDPRSYLRGHASRLSDAAWHRPDAGSDLLAVLLFERGLFTGEDFDTLSDSFR